MPRSITQPPPGERRVVEPRLVRAVGVVEHEVGTEQLAELAGTAARARAERLGVPVGEVDPEQPVGASRGLDDAPRLGRRAARAASGRTPRGRARAPRSPARRAARSASRSRRRRGPSSSSSSSESSASGDARGRRPPRPRRAAAAAIASSRVRPIQPTPRNPRRGDAARPAHVGGSHALTGTQRLDEAVGPLARRSNASPSRSSGNVCVTSGAGRAARRGAPRRGSASPRRTPPDRARARSRRRARASSRAACRPRAGRPGGSRR